MDRLVRNANKKLKDIIKELEKSKLDIEDKVQDNRKKIEEEIETVKKYKEEFISAKEKIDKMNADIEGFEEDYQNLVDRFKNDELANILVAANKEISAKIDERKRKIINDKMAMNDLVTKAEAVKKKLVSLTAEKKTLEAKCENITNIYNFYQSNIQSIITYTEENPDSFTANIIKEVKVEPVSTEEVVNESIDNTTEETFESNEKIDFDNVNLDQVFDSDMILEINLDDDEDTKENEIEIDNDDIQIDEFDNQEKVEDNTEDVPLVPEEIFDEIKLDDMDYSDDEIINFEED